MSYESLKLSSARQAERRATALRQAAQGSRFAEGAYEIQLLIDASHEAAERGDDDLALAIKGALRGADPSPAQYRVLMAASRAAEGSAGNGTAAKSIAKPTTGNASTTTKSAPAKPAAPTITSFDVQRAAANARAAERQRWEAVMLSSDARGRERVAAAMLSSEDSSADTIRARLAKMPTTAERQAKAAAASQERASAVWDRAIAAQFGTKGDAQ